VIVLRCTARLQKRLKLPKLAEPGPSTTALGDWYGNVFNLGRQPLVILTSERSLLSVVLPARGLDDLPARFPIALMKLLLRLGVPGAAIDRELGQMNEVVYGATRNRRVLGVMNDAVMIIKYVASTRPELGLQDFEDDIAKTPYRPLPDCYPRDVALKLLA